MPRRPVEGMICTGPQTRKSLELQGIDMEGRTQTVHMDLGASSSSDEERTAATCLFGLLLRSSRSGEMQAALLSLVPRTRKPARALKLSLSPASGPDFSLGRARLAAQRGETLVVEGVIA